MLKILVKGGEIWDTAKSEFISVPSQELHLEHSLLSVSKWESKWCKPFLTKTPHTAEEMLDYIRCMTLNQNVDPYVYALLSQSNIDDITNYIDAPMTGTTFSDKTHQRPMNRVVTSELIYCWMINCNIPVQFEKWHLNRLMTLIRVCGEENNPKKMSKKDIYAQNTALNKARRAASHSKG